MVSFRVPKFLGGKEGNKGNEELKERVEERFIACRQASIYEHSTVSFGRGVASAIYGHSIVCMDGVGLVPSSVQG